MNKLPSTYQAGNENHEAAPAGPLNPAIVKAIARYLDTYPTALKGKVLAAMGPAQSAVQKHKQP